MIRRLLILILVGSFSALSLYLNDENILGFVKDSLGMITVLVIAAYLEDRINKQSKNN
jgi:hypothetical protein